MPLILFVLALISAWVLKQIAEPPRSIRPDQSHVPDYYVEDFTTLVMDEGGSPQNKLRAEFMAHDPQDDSTRLVRPTLEVFREGRPPWYVTADSGRVTSDNEVIQLLGVVRMWRNNDKGERDVEVITSDVRILRQMEYLETDRDATLRTNTTVINAVGMRAYLDDNRLELLSQVRGYHELR
ncbi:MAG: LPS export ABC transporter periplasmic protein LptC [Gammaproteobacteria bacterium]|nr:LPS export ABC transporter periplasmic protein LptC [Gammaproteobacteria bacterium]MCI0590515.1 LPS export ABC transporter periplasmic protein LptC [Gammaproteobacteria bacterium]